MSYNKASYLALSLLILLGVAYLWSATEIRDPNTRGSIGPGYFPIILGILLVLLSAVSLVQTMLSGSDRTITIPNLGYVLIGLAATAIFLILWKYLEVFYPLVFVFVAGLMTLFSKPAGNRRRYAIILVVSLMVTLAIYGLFSLIMGVRF